jgi:trk system potassium uptake protein TrkA
MGVANIVVKAETDEHGEILGLVGATQVIFPDREAARRVTPMLASSSLFNYMPLSPDLVIAEVRVSDKLAGKTLIEANLRQNYGINVIALHKGESKSYEYFQPDYRLQAQDVVLVAGKEADVVSFSGIETPTRKGRSTDFFKNIFNKKE